LPHSSEVAPTTPVAEEKRIRPLPARAVTTITAPSPEEKKPKKGKAGNFITRWIQWGDNDATKIKKKRKEQT